MAVSIRTGFNAFKEAEKRLKYRFWDKERERSQRAAGIADVGPQVPLCPMNHDTIAWSGPPHNPIRMYVCLRCNAYASEPMIKDMGYDFENVPDWIMKDLMTEVLRRKSNGNPTVFLT